MNDASKSMDDLMHYQLQDGSYRVAGGNALFMEVMDTSTGLVWMSAAAVEMSDFEALEIEDPLRKVGCAQASMDIAAFQYSPGAPNEPVLERFIQGRLFINVAAPGKPSPSNLQGGPIEILVNKAHVVGFEAGRTVTVLTLPEGDYVELVGDNSQDENLVLPEGSRLKQIKLSQPWIVTLPSPTRTFFWFGDSMRSFQGPVALPDTL